MNNKHLTNLLKNHLFEVVIYPSGEADIRVVDIELLTKDSIRFCNKINASIFYIKDTPQNTIMYLTLLDLWAREISVMDSPSYHLRPVKVLVPYLPFGRSDKKTPLSSRGLDVYSKFEALSIYTVDPHASGRYFNYTTYNHNNNELYNLIDGYDFIVYADKSANRTLRFLKCDKENEALATLKYLQATKDRDFSTGQMSNFRFDYESSSVSKEDIIASRNVLVIDDICDGGGTFIPISNNLKSLNENIEIDLYVTHGLFTKGLETLKQHYNHIITTNSVHRESPLVDDNVTVINLLE